MTGFGAATQDLNGLQITAEVKCLNSKFAEVFVRLPRELNDKETEVRNAATTSLERGKINVSIDLVKPQGTTLSRGINLPVFQAWYQQLLEAANSVGAGDEGLVKLALTMPEVMSQPAADPEATTALWQAVQAVLKDALANCNTFRADEGRVLAAKLSEYIGEIRERLLVIEAHDPERLALTRQRLFDRIAELGQKVQVDHNRFEQELIYYLEKLDVSEEKVRLRAHLDYFVEAIAEGNGKKLGFISQEIGREINTIGSKINDASVQRIVVEMKDLLERIKEQCLNVM